MTAKKTTSKPKPKKQKRITFYSRFPDLTMVRKPRRHERDGHGDVIGMTGPEPGESPWEVQFQGEFFETDDPVLIEFLRGSQDFNVNIWEEGAAPDEPRPTADEQHKLITAATINRDREALDELIAEERETHNRAPIIRAAEFARDQFADTSELDGPAPINGANGPSDADKPAE